MITMDKCLLSLNMIISTLFQVYDPFFVVLFSMSIRTTSIESTNHFTRHTDQTRSNGLDTRVLCCSVNQIE